MFLFFSFVYSPWRKNQFAVSYYSHRDWMREEGRWGVGGLISHTRPVLKRIIQCVKTGKRLCRSGQNLNKNTTWNFFMVCNKNLSASCLSSGAGKLKSFLRAGCQICFFLMPCTCALSHLIKSKSSSEIWERTFWVKKSTQEMKVQIKIIIWKRRANRKVGRK